MKHFLLSIAAVCLVAVACGNNGKKAEVVNENVETQNDNNMKTLVAYFSATGTTEALAQKIAEVTGGTLYQIKPEVPYTAADLDWTNKKSRSTVEMQDPACRPALADDAAPVAEADVIFLGFPIWWYREPSVIDSFLDTYDFTGKTVVPFFTSGGSQLGEGQGRIEKLAKGAKVLPGKRFSARASEDELKNWIDALPLE